MPDNKIFKSENVDDDGTGMTVQNLGPEEEFANDILKSLKDKISEARNRLSQIEDDIEKKKQQAETKRDEILEEARQEAEQIRQEAENEAEQIIQEKQNEVDDARNEGYEDGYQDGMDDARSDMADYLEQVRDVLSEAKNKREAHIEDNDSVLVKLAGKISQQIIRDYVEYDEETIKRVVSSAIEEVSDVEQITIVVSPDDANILEDVKNEFLDEHPSLKHVAVADDPNMERGGCRIKTKFGDIQGTVEGQVEHLTETLLEFEEEDNTQLSESSE